jgi:hypothetical protein
MRNQRGAWVRWALLALVLAAIGVAGAVLVVLATRPAAADFVLPTVRPSPTTGSAETLGSGPGGTPGSTPTRAPYPFIPADAVRYVANFANSAGCAWQGVGGNVIGLDGAPLAADTARVYVYNDRFEARVAVGSNSLFGDGSGWEVRTGNSATAEAFFVVLEALDGAPLSPVVQVRFPGTCATNVAIVLFRQEWDPREQDLEGGAP